ncbi:hypothetical protein [Streptomyces sp. NBC_01431]|uniref:hypothetical protein n=1 Tax=Streptomyces sp. NBC_01431 TaxID=2903863 RepID=UPI002E31A70D|nr:hypothetical protein [Streptomyces sp. NBC_01431]
MAVIALVGVPGAPGVTSTALGLLRMWPVEHGRRVLLAECCPDGGAVLAGALQSRLTADRGLHNLAASRRSVSLQDAFWTQLVRISDEDRRDDPTRMLLPGLTSPAEAAGLAPEWGAIADLFVGIDRIEQHGHDVLLDLGRNGAFGPARVLAQRADLVLLVMRSTLRSLHMAAARVRMLTALLDGEGRRSGRLGVLLITEGPYAAREVEEHLQVPVVASLPFRPQEAAVLSDGAAEGKRFRESKLMRAVLDASTPIRQRVATQRARLASPLHQRMMGGPGAR